MHGVGRTWISDLALVEILRDHEVEPGTNAAAEEIAGAQHDGADAAVGGPSALIQNGDKIVIDAEAGTIDLHVPEDEIAARRAAWKPRPTNYNAGAIWKYAQLVGPAYLGALTHPGTAAETHC